MTSKHCDHRSGICDSTRLCTRHFTVDCFSGGGGEGDGRGEQSWLQSMIEWTLAYNWITVIRHVCHDAPTLWKLDTLCAPFHLDFKNHTLRATSAGSQGDSCTSSQKYWLKVIDGTWRKTSQKCHLFSLSELMFHRETEVKRWTDASPWIRTDSTPTA